MDSGASTKCNYEQVVLLAKQETAKGGGNALALTDHRKPSLLGSSCHQIAGNMLWIGDTIQILNQETTSVQTAFHQNSGSNTETGKTSFQHNTFFAHIGYAFMTSKFYLPQGASGNPKNGLDWQVGYKWVSRNGFGAGLMYSGYKSSYAYSGLDVKLGLVYIAPQFVMKQIAGRWIFQENVGVGYFSQRESTKGLSESLSGVGYNLTLRMEYLLSQHVGIGANLGYIGGSLPKQDNLEYKKGESSGIYRLQLDAGIRFHF